MLRLTQPFADVFVPSGGLPDQALRRVTHLCIAAHHDDIEIMAHAGICDSLADPEHHAFGGVVVTDGAGALRTGRYAHFSDAQMSARRREEQRNAAALGSYAIQIQLAHSSARLRDPQHSAAITDILTILSICRSAVLYLHSPADKHDTHVAVLTRCLAAIRKLPEPARPQRVLGCEVWRDLDWLLDSDKVALDSGRRPDLSRRLLRAFDSQISSGKRYDEAILGRRAAHATFHTPTATDHFAGITWAIDLTPLIRDAGPSLIEFTVAHIDRLRADTLTRIARVAGESHMLRDQLHTHESTCPASLPSFPASQAKFTSTH